MKIPARPPVGHVVAYVYLWSSKARKRRDGEKVYTTALILSKRDELGSTIVDALGWRFPKDSAASNAIIVDIAIVSL
jgi:hypothetical protein